MPNQRTYFVYILASKRNGTLYIGITNDLTRRVLEHKDKIIKGFTSKYGVDKLVYYESFQYVNDAIKRETTLKSWKIKWKLELIETENKNWKDLFNDLTSEDEIKRLRENIKFRESNKSDIDLEINRRRERMSIELISEITCPNCGHKKKEIMPADACVYFYECDNCKTLLKPLEGDCCVYCSYGSVKCPPIQKGNSCC